MGHRGGTQHHSGQGSRSIGEWTDEQILGALTRGVAADGRRLLPPMGARAAVYSHITAGDLHDLIAYLRSLPSQ